MWSYEVLDESGLASALRRLQKDYPEETATLFSRLRSFVAMLNSGLSLPQVRTRGWVHDKYKQGMLSIDAGGGRGQAKLRLYILPDRGRVTVLVVGAGIKGTQERDVRRAYALVEEYKQQYPESKS